MSVYDKFLRYVPSIVGLHFEDDSANGKSEAMCSSRLLLQTGACIVELHQMQFSKCQHTVKTHAFSEYKSSYCFNLIRWGTDTKDWEGRG